MERKKGPAGGENKSGEHSDCVYCPGDVHWARLGAAALGSFCCLPRMERKKGRAGGENKSGEHSDCGCVSR